MTPVVTDRCIAALQRFVDRVGMPRLVRDEGKSISQVSRDLDLTQSAVGRWVKQSAIDAGEGGTGALTTAERTELVALRREARQLRMEREILKKAAACFAKENQ